MGADITRPCMGAELGRGLHRQGGRYGLCRRHRQCFIEENIVGVSHAASGIDEYTEKSVQWCWRMLLIEPQIKAH